MLDSNFFNILQSPDNYGQYDVGDYLVTLYNNKSSASIHRIIGSSEHEYTLLYIGYYNERVSDELVLFDDAPKCVEKKEAVIRNFRDGYCISANTFNLLLLNYA